MATPKNVANPSLYAKAKAKAKAKFDVYPSAYANAYMVKEYKKMGGKNCSAVKSFIARGCGAIDPSRRKKTKMRMS